MLTLLIGSAQAEIGPFPGCAAVRPRGGL